MRGPTRRGIMSAIAIAPVVIVAPAVAQSSGSAAFRAALDRADAGRARFCNLPEDLETYDPAAFERETNRLIASAREADRAIPTTWEEFGRLIEHMTDNGHSTVGDENGSRLLRHTRRLLAG